VLNSGPALKVAAHMAGSTNPEGLEEMTISMLKGESGEQKEELDKLINWIVEHCNPDVIHISNALLLGLVKRIKEKLDVLVVCTLQDEDVWVNAMNDHFRKATWELMKDRAADVDAFFAVSNYYRTKMKSVLAIPDEKLVTCHITLAPEDYRSTLQKPQNIGYLSRMCESNGLELVIDAFTILKKDPKWQMVKLIITGGSTGDDHRFLKKIKRKIKRGGLRDFVEFHKDFEGEGRHDFFSKISLLSVPVLEGEAFGLYLLEAMASGVPVVQPATGAFPEIIEKSGGGVIYQPNTPAQLAKIITGLLMDPEKLSGLAEKGKQGVNKNFNIHRQANEIIKFYQKIREQKRVNSNVT
ncbi:MAG: glycosyltransferase family 4 protein, partial [Saprospiraceae bacterium]|nr:glycosyltransferase family 4 protein [Saprospiraceae bacterium]